MEADVEAAAEEEEEDEEEEEEEEEASIFSKQKISQRSVPKKQS